MEMPTVSDQMKRLTDLLAGRWQGDEKLYPSQWDPAGGAARGSWNVQVAADGFALVVDYQEERDGKIVYRGHGVHGWDGRQGTFLAYWFDNMGGFPERGTRATLDGDRYTYSEAGPSGHTRFTYRFEGGELLFTIERSDDGATWAPMHEGRYQRA